MRIRSDHGREFENAKFEEFCLSYGIQQEFSSPITPQQNGVVERKNMMIQEMARVMIHSKNLLLFLQLLILLLVLLKMRMFPQILLSGHG
jgi:transposase InsO family protein